MYENLVFSGGGMRGITFVGVLKKLEEENILQNITKFAGSSAGSLCAGCLACGCPVEKLEAYLRNVDPKIFKTHGYGGIFRKIYNLFKCHGVYSTKGLKKWCQTSIGEICGDQDITFSQVYEKFGNELVITGTTINPEVGQTVYFSRHTGFSEMKIVDAMVISCCIPFYYKHCKYRDGVYVDGGILDYIPMHVFDRKIFGGDNYHNEKSLGISLSRMINSQDGEPPYYQILNSENQPPNSLFKYISRMVNTIYAHSQWAFENSDDASRIIQIDSTDFSILDFEYEDQEKDQLIERGYQATSKFLAEHSK